MRRFRNRCIRILPASLALLAGAIVACASEQPDPTLRELAATGTGREMYPLFDPGIHHYAVGCGEQSDLTLILSTTDADTRLTVDGVVRPNREAVVELTGLTGDSDIVIELSDKGRGAIYTVHCLPDDFPTVTARKSPGNSDILVTAAVGEQYIAILDTHGVPRFHLLIDVWASVFKYHKDGFYPYSYARLAGRIPGFASETYNNREMVILDWDMNEVDTVQVVPPLIHTNAHDFVIKPNGNYVLMSYEPARRDFSSFHDQDGNLYSTTEGTRDSVIQEITPEREQVFLWNSWDHMAIEDCTQHRFPDDYAHINSLAIVDGDIIASFRGCSQVLRIDGASGDIVWLLGKSNRSDADWIASGKPAPLKIVGDPYGEFCAQHSARLKPNGNLVLFDNGGPCLVDPATGATGREDSVFSRAVEYSLDPENGRATFLRHHSLHGTFAHFTLAAGHVELLDNGNWLISWGRGHDDETAPDASITEVDPLTGEELLTIVITDGDAVLRTRAYPLPPDALERSRD